MLVSVKAITSPFLSIIERNFSSELFFEGLLSDKDLSKLLCTCRVMKEMILKWKYIFPIKQISINSEMMTNKMLVNLINHYSSNIIKLIVSDGDVLFDSIALLHSNLLKLDITKCFCGKLPILSYSLSNLTSLAITDSSMTEDLQDFAFKGFSTMIRMKSIKIKEVNGLSGLGLGYLLAEKELLTALTINNCQEIPSDGFHCLTILTNLTKLSVHRTNIDPLGLQMILLNCFLIEFLYISHFARKFYKLMSFSNQTNLQRLCLNVDYFGLESLSIYCASMLTYLNIDSNDDEQFYLSLSSLYNLKHLILKGRNEILTNERLSILSTTLVRLSHLTLSNFRMSFRNLFQLSSVVCLEIEDCVISPDDGVDVEYPFLEKLTYLSLKDITVTDDDEDVLSDELLFPLPTKLTFLSIVQNDDDYPGLDSQMLVNISSLSYLIHYKLKHSIDKNFFLNKTSVAGLSYLSSLSNLDYLHVSEAIYDENLLFLSSLSNLTHLSLGVNSAISNIGLSHLSSMQKLSYLDLGKKSAISDFGLSYISSHTNLTYLALGRKSYITDQGISHLSSCVNLTKLWLGPKSKISYQGISKLTSLTMLSNISSLFSYDE
jgi:hypothetical protein